ncbi:MAG: hypothetical protein ACI9OJ_001089 [Myxococcota bacterium]|jgi:hypothetical protein
MSRILVVSSLLIFGACSSDTDETHAHGTDVIAAAATCDPSTVDAYAVGLSRATEGGTWMVEMMGAMPSPPDVGLNQFQVKVTDAAGTAVEGVTVTIEPRMPEHGHGTVPATFVSQTSGTGEATVPATTEEKMIDLIMPGAWLLHFHVEDSAGTRETASYTFCAQG